MVPDQGWLWSGARRSAAGGGRGVAALHALVAGHLAEDVEPGEVVGIETDRGPLVQALIAAGYLIDAVNPLHVARYRARHGTSGAEARPRECARAGRAAFDAA